MFIRGVQQLVGLWHRKATKLSLQLIALNVRKQYSFCIKYH